MNTETEAYRPFFNRRLSPAIRELLANRQPFLAEAAQYARRHFSGPSLLREVTVVARRPMGAAFLAQFSRSGPVRNR